MSYVTATEIPEVKIITPRIFEDQRGYFFESYNQTAFNAASGLAPVFMQDNESFSHQGTLRGLHYQLDPKAQTKLVRVISGRIFDVAVDIRKTSPTFRSWVGVELTSDNKKQLLVPKGFAHGFLVLSETAIVQYKVDAPYSSEFERGIRYDDPILKIEWPASIAVVLSDKDRVLPALSNADLFG